MSGPSGPATTPDATGRDARIPLARRAWRQLLTFLEIIGLRHESPADQGASLARFRLYHTEFRKLLSANNALLETIAELERKASGREYFDTSFIQRRVVRAVADVHSMVRSLSVISGDRYPPLADALHTVTRALNASVARPEGDDELVVDLPATFGSHADLVGGKMANLGEVRNAVGLPTPDGFTVTTQGFHVFVDESELASSLLESQAATPSDEHAAGEAPEQRILAAAVPARLVTAIEEAYDRLAGRCGREVAVAVRSSALGEDGSRSFAGQFRTELNVTRAGLAAAYRRVVASLYSPEANDYRKLHGIPPTSAAMAVGFVAMVDAATAGVAFSRHPSRPASGEVLIHAVSGLGVSLVEGMATPEAVVVAGGEQPRVVSRTLGQQAVRVACRTGDGVCEEALDGGGAASGLSEADALALARWAHALEAHFGCPQDVEWAAEEQHRLWLLQSRPLRVAAVVAAATEPHPGAHVLLAGGETACPGIGSGTAVLVDEAYDLDAFPDGGVLLARRPSPRFIRVMARARAIVTDVGSTTGHMASLARELRVPTLLATREATAAIAAGRLITVDAGGRFVYDGEVTGIAAASAPADPDPLPGSQAQELALLRRVSEMIIPLNLTDPRSHVFAAEHCRTLHDIARFVHEKSYEEMFRMGAGLGDLRPSSYYLDVFLPMDLYIIDLGGGLIAPVRGNKVKPADVLSAPLTALLRGVLDKRIPRFGARRMDVGGFVSVMMRHALSSPEEDRTFRDPCYALVSDCYLNYTARVGYHFGVVDCYCSETPNKNYISMQFKGGAADRVRRGRRARAIAGVLQHHGFSVRSDEDLVSARLSKPSLEEAKEQLEMLGRLLQFFRQMDAAMTSEAAVGEIRQAFLDGDFGFGAPPGPEAGA
jgi:pyruvate, water dikinase